MGLPSDLNFLHATNLSGNRGRRRICKRKQSCKAANRTVISSCDHCLMMRVILRLYVTTGTDLSRSCQNISVPLASGGQNGHLICGVVGRLRLYRPSPRPLRLTIDVRYSAVYMTIRIGCSVFAVRRCMRQNAAINHIRAQQHTDPCPARGATERSSGTFNSSQL